MSTLSATPCQVWLPEGIVRVETCESGNVAILTFNERFGEVELARGSWERVFRKLSELRDDGVPVGPAHVPGQPQRWTSLSHDGSLRSAVPGGHLQIVTFTLRTFLLLFVDAMGGCVGVAVASDVRALQQRAITWTPAGHTRWSIFFRGRRVVLQASSRRGVVAVARVDRAVIHALALETDVPTLRLELREDGRTEVLADVPLVLGAHEAQEILWSDGSEIIHGPPHALQRTSAPTWPRQPSGRATLGVSAQTLEEFVHQPGVGREMRELVVARLLLLAEKGVKTIRCRASGPKLRARLEQTYGRLPGSVRTFQYVRKQLEVAGILLREGDDFVLPVAGMPRASRPAADPVMRDLEAITRDSDVPLVERTPDEELNLRPSAPSGSGTNTTARSDKLAEAEAEPSTPSAAAEPEDPEDPEFVAALFAADVASARASGITSSNAVYLIAEALRDLASDGLFQSTSSLRDFLSEFPDQDGIMEHQSTSQLARAAMVLCDTYSCHDPGLLPDHVITRIEELL